MIPLNTRTDLLLFLPRLFSRRETYKFIIAIPLLVLPLFLLALLMLLLTLSFVLVLAFLIPIVIPITLLIALVAGPATGANFGDEVAERVMRIVDGGMDMLDDFADFVFDDMDRAMDWVES